MQGGAAVDQVLNAEHEPSRDRLRRRAADPAYLALTGIGATSSGGVVDLNRNFEGVGVAVDLQGQPARSAVDAQRGRRWRAHARAAAGLRQQQRRPWARCGGTKTTPSPAATSTPRPQWYALPALSLTLGVRSSQVKYDSVDHYIVGPIRTTAARAPTTTRAPIVGLVWHAADNLNVYASYGQGFETPTFAEIAYRPTGTGLNLALDPATSTVLRDRR